MTNVEKAKKIERDKKQREVAARIKAEKAKAKESKQRFNPYPKGRINMRPHFFA